MTLLNPSIYNNTIRDFSCDPSTCNWTVVANPLFPDGSPDICSGCDSRDVCSICNGNGTLCDCGKGPWGKQYGPT